MMKRKMSKAEARRRREGYLWIAPAFIIVSLATIFPLVFAFDYSLYETNVFTKIKFVGLEKYIELLKDSRFWTDVFNSLFFTAGGIVIALIVGFIIALMIRKPGKMNSVYRTIILIPWVTNEVVLALMWTWVLNPQMSIIYYWADMLGFSLPNFFEGKITPLITITVLNAWRSLGFSLVMILAALSAIPQELEEAALVDGCSRIQRIRYITIPMIRSVVLVMVIVLTMSFFNIVSFVLSMTGGGPMYTTEILSIRLYKEAFTFFKISLSAALTTVMLVLNLVFVFIYKKLITDEDYY